MSSKLEEEISIKLSDRDELIYFEAPRHSLITSIKHEIFDDMLIGNFMKTKLINCESLYPNFSPYVAKYGDNGLAKSQLELKNCISSTINSIQQTIGEIYSQLIQKIF